MRTGGTVGGVRDRGGTGTAVFIGMLGTASAALESDGPRPGEGGNTGCDDFSVAAAIITRETTVHQHANPIMVNPNV